MKILSIKYLLLLFIACSCNRYESDEISLSVVSSFMHCEQENIHLKVIYSEREDLIGQVILPVCDKETTCVDHFYNMKASDSLKKYDLKGYLSKKVHNKFDYGCIDSKYFKITNLIFVGNNSPASA